MAASLITNVARTCVGPLFRLLCQIEERAGAGVLTFERPDGTPAGMAVICDGRLCLVRGVGGVLRFTDVLAARHPESSALLANAIRTARREGRLIGEVLAELGQIPLAHLRSCLRDQVLACVVALASEADVARMPAWSPLKGTFDARLTFSPVELFGIVSEHLPSTPADVAQQLFESYAGEAAFAVLAVKHARTLLPVRVCGVETPSLEYLRALGRHVLAIGSPPALHAAGIDPRVVSFNTGEQFGVVCTGPAHVTLLGGLTTAGRGRVMRDAADLLRARGRPS